MNKELYVLIVYHFQSCRKSAQAVGLNPSVISLVLNGKWILKEEQKEQWCKLLPDVNLTTSRCLL